MFKRLVCSLTVVLLVAATAAVGQDAGRAGTFGVGVRLGYDTYSSSTGIDNGALIGIEADFFVSNNFAIGAYADFSRPSTDGTFFPAELTFGAEDSTMIFAVSQPLTVIKFGLELLGTTKLGSSFNPYLLVGAGAYQVQVDAQVNRANESSTNFQFTIGGGLALDVGRSSAIIFDVRNYFLTNFERARLDPVDARFLPTRFPDVLPVPAPACDGGSCTESNLVFAIAFQFTPGG